MERRSSALLLPLLHLLQRGLVLQGVDQGRLEDHFLSQAACRLEVGLDEADQVLLAIESVQCFKSKVDCLVYLSRLL